MQVATGKSVLNGIAIGKLKLFKKASKVISEACVENCDAELERLENARQKAIEQQTALYEKALAEAGEDAPLGCNVRRGAGTGENNILAAYKHENGLSLRNLAEILGSNYTTVMYDCRNESCRPYFVAILAEYEGLTVGEFMEKYGR